MACRLVLRVGSDDVEDRLPVPLRVERAQPHEPRPVDGGIRREHGRRFRDRLVESPLDEEDLGPDRVDTRREPCVAGNMREGDLGDRERFLVTAKRRERISFRRERVRQLRL